MKASEKKEVLIECIKLLMNEFKARPYNIDSMHLDGQYYLDTPIGVAEIRLDIFGGTLMGLVVNFTGEPVIAKRILGHWKQNLHVAGSPDFTKRVKAHLEDLFERIKNSDAWMYMACSRVFDDCFGLAYSLEKGNPEAVETLASKTGFSSAWIKKHKPTLIRLGQSKKRVV